MVSNSTSDSLFTKEKIERMQKHLLEHPIDHRFDAVCDEYDSQAPIDQILSRDEYDILKDLGKLPPGIE